jgi:MFS transporter, DHA2 family, multidrug resistance protein
MAHGLHIALPVGELGIAAGLGMIVLHRQANHQAPLIPVDLLRLPMFSLSVATAFCAFAAQSLAFVSLPFRTSAQQARLPLRASTRSTAVANSL